MGPKDGAIEKDLSANLLLLKKIVFCLYRGWFRFNAQAPLQAKSLFDYLSDGRYLIIDFKLINLESRAHFLEWLLKDHVESASQYLSSKTTSTNQDLVSEKNLSYWGYITNYLYYKESYLNWPLPEIAIFSYFLASLDIKQVEGALLVKLNKTLLDKEGKRILDISKQEKADKRLFMTDSLIMFCLHMFDGENFNYEKWLKAPHLFSLQRGEETYSLAMQEYRKTKALEIIQPTSSAASSSYSWFGFYKKTTTTTETTPLPLPTPIPVPNNELLFESPILQIYRHKERILVMEKRPELDSITFCGGGAKIFGHIGAIRAKDEFAIPICNFSGSSGGGIIALLQYLGYSADEIEAFFKNFNKDKLMYNEFDRSGISSGEALKAALDFMIIKKLNKIIRQYKLDETEKGRQFLASHVFKEGKICFSSLFNLKKRFPDCELGEALFIVATDLDTGEAAAFSRQHNDVEISLAVTASAAFPWVFKPIVINGTRYVDGGLTSNFPTEFFRDNKKTFLQSESGNSLSLLALQFDNGQERRAVDEFNFNYDEGQFANFLYGTISGVYPVAHWKKDRKKLVSHSHQTVVIPVGNTVSTNFDLSKEERDKLQEQGYEYTKAYFDSRYTIVDGKAVNEEYLYNHFTSLKELLYYCCYRGDLDWFRKVAELAKAKNDCDEQEINELEMQFFSINVVHEEELPMPMFETTISEAEQLIKRFNLFEAIYTVFYTIPDKLIVNPKEINFFKQARHNYSLDDPFKCLDSLNKIRGETHLVLAIFIKLIRNYKEQQNVQDLYFLKLKTLRAMFYSEELLGNKDLYAAWDLTYEQIEALLTDFEDNQQELFLNRVLAFKTGTDIQMLPEASSSNQLS